MSDPSTKSEKAFFTIPEFVERWTVSRMTIYREVPRGRLKTKHIGGTVRFAVGDVAEYERQAG